MTSLHRSQRWLRDLAAVFRSPAPRRPRRRLALEALEGRALLSYVTDWNVDLGVLVEGTGIQGRSVAVDQAGNSYVTGALSGTGDFDPNAAPADGSDILASRTMVVDYYQVNDAFVAKYAPDGHLIWVRGFGGDGDDAGNDVAVDDSGNVYVTGWYCVTHGFSVDGTAGFGVDASGSPVTLTEAGGGDVFVVKLDASGNTVWARSMGGIGPDYLFNARGGIGVDDAGNVFTSGSFAGTADFDQTAVHADNSDLLTEAGGGDFFVTKHAPDGSLIWARRIGNGGPELAGGLAVDPAGNVLLTGQFRDKVDFDPGPGTSTLGRPKFGESGFVLKLNGAGGFVWAKNVGWSALDVASDGSGNVLATGSNGGGTGFVAKFTPGGGSTWTKTFEVDTGHFGGESIAVDAAGNSYVTGAFSRTVDMDPGKGTYYLTAQGASDAFVLVLSSGGGFVTATRLGGSGQFASEFGFGIAVDTAGNVYVVGIVQETNPMIVRKLKRI